MSTPQPIHPTQEQIDSAVQEMRAIMHEAGPLHFAKSATLDEQVILALADREDSLRSQVSRLTEQNVSMEAEICILNEQVSGLNRLVASVPDLVKNAFHDGFAGNGSLALGPAWEQSRAKRVLDGQATPRPAAWDSDRARIAALEARINLFSELRDALVESMGTEGGIPMTDRLAAALEICGVEAKREAPHA